MPPPVPLPLTRRQLLLAACGLGLMASPAAALPAAPERGIRFDLVRSGVSIGSHTVDFGIDGGGLGVETRIDVRVAPLGVVLFAYRHRSRERYEGDRLVAFDSETDDDDSRFFVHGRAETDGFRVRTKKGEALLSADTMVGSFWTPATLARPMLLDPQRGRLKPQTIEGRERLRLTLAGQEVAATRYRISGIINGTVTYDDAGRWLAATLLKKGSEIVYRLQP